MALYIVQPGATTEAKPAPNLPHLGIEQQPLVQSTIGKTFFTNQSGATSDYQKYLFGAPTKIDHVSEPTTLSFSLVPYDSSFVKLQRGAYIIMFTSTYGYWYSGYITNEPQLTYLGTTRVAGVSTPIWGYQYQAISDEYLLNLNTLGVMPPFVNTTQGAILKAIINQICPGQFNTTNIQNGQPVARYVVDPMNRFSDIIKDFADQSAFRFWARMKSINFVPYDFVSSPITIDGNDKHFTPANLSLSMVDEQVVNDVVVLGDIEPQTYMTEFFVGDGVTGSYPLSSDVYGVDSTVLLTDDFSSSSIDTTKWTLSNTANNYLQIANGYVNLLGGDGVGGVYGTVLQSANLIPLEGHLRLTHGEWDFVSASSGVICGLWTQPANSSLTGCVYGLLCTKVGANMSVSPIVNGVADLTQSITIDYTKRYVIRTLFFATRCHRFNHGWGFLRQNGTTGNANSLTLADSVSYSTAITAIDPLTAQISPTITFNNNTVPLSTSQTNAYYVPAADDDLHCTFTQVTISTPLQAKLSARPVGSYAYTPMLIGPNELDALDGLAPAATIVDSNNGATTRSSLLGTPQYNSSAAILQYFKNSVNLTATLPQKGDLVSLSYRRPGSVIVHVQNQSLISSEAAVWGDNGIRTATISGSVPLPRNSDEAEQLGSAALQDAGYQHFEGNYKQWSNFSFTSEPMAGMVVKFANLPSPPFFGNLQAELITQVSTTFNSFNSGERFEHTFSFGKIDRTKQVLSKLTRTDGIFLPQDSVELPFYIDYRQVGTTFVPDITAQPTLFQFLNGNLLPNNDFENGNQYWSTAVALSGCSVTYVNNPVNAHTGNSYVELTAANATSAVLVEIEATSDLLGTNACFYPVSQGDIVTFGGWVNNVVGTSGLIEVAAFNSSRAQVGGLATSAVTAGTGWNFVTATYTVPAGVAYLAFVAFISGPAANPSTTRFDGLFVTNSNRMYIGINAVPPSGGGFQIRYTDDSWGAAPARNLVITTTDTVIAIPRNARGKSVFIRPFDGRNKILWSEDSTQWTAANGATVANSTQRNPDNDISTISTVTQTAVSGSEIFQVSAIPVSGQTATYTVSVKGQAGKKVRICVQASLTPFLTFSNSVTFTGLWQRVSVTGTWVGGTTGTIVAFIDNAADVLAKSFQVTRHSLEIASAETVYCKTLGTVFGAMSRFSSGVRINHPLIPTAPSASVTYLLPSSPVITVGLPASLSDVWGTEIRASDNSTVLYHKDLVDANYLPQFTDTVTLNRNLNYFLYTYNLLGEYSPATNFTLSIPNSASGNVGTGKNGLYNPGFEIDEISTPYIAGTKLATGIGTYVSDAWFVWDNSGINGAAMQAAVDRTATFPKSGNSCMLIRVPSGLSLTNGTQQRLIITSEPIPATPGKYYYVAGNIRTDGTLGSGTLTGRLSLLFSDSTGTFVSQTLTTNVSSITNSYIFKDVKSIAPAGASFVQVSLEVYYNNASGGTISTPLIDTRFDDLFLAQSTDPSFPDVLTTGSIPPTLSGGFTYTSTSSSITWSWSSLVLLRADGTSTNIGSGSQAVTGLATPSTAYFFYPYYDELTAQLVWLAAAGGVGSPAIAYTTKTQALANLQTLQSRVPLSAPGLSASTDSVGGGGGAGGGGGSGTCLRSTMFVNKFGVGNVVLSSCEVGDYIRGKNGRWTRIISKQVFKHTTWIRITLPSGEWLDCTPSHGFTMPLGGNKYAYQLTLNDLMYVAECAETGILEVLSTIKRIEVVDEEGERVMITCKYDDSEEDEGHLFYAGATAPIILTHNPVLPC